MVSVIVPVYNVDNYLENCIQSILSQTFRDLELILIDDGSTDMSGAICDKYKLLDKRVSVLHTKNLGQASARNTGIELSKGDFIAFVDSDDTIVSSMYEVLYDALVRHNADIACCGVRYVENHKDTESVLPLFESSSEEILDRQQTFHYMCSQTKVRFQVWNKLFRRDLIGNIKFKTGQKYEEIYFERNVLSKVNRVVYIDAPLYNYLISRPGNTNSIFNEQKLHVFGELDDLYRQMVEYTYIDISKKVLGIRLVFSVNLGIEARKHNANKNMIKQLDKEFNTSYAMCKQYRCGNIKLGMLYRISPRLVCFLRMLRTKQQKRILNG